MIWESHHWKEPLLKMADRIEKYSQKKGLTEQRDVLFVTHKVIHSFIMVGSPGGDGEPSGDFFTSDRDKEKRLYFVSAAETVALFRVVGSDYPNFEFWTDKQTGERKWSAPAAKGEPSDG